MKTIIAATAFALGATGGAASAGDIKGGSSLLDASRHAQLERWNGAGEFNLTKVYTLQPGDTARDFHAAVDGKGGPPSRCCRSATPSATAIWWAATTRKAGPRPTAGTAGAALLGIAACRRKDCAAQQACSRP